ncbi:MAG: NUDIX domain-containing protein [Alphaproteobacteria bacterium]|nr:NUDIX domain-containing protein [Alphaproteobacteria bacterium]
MKHRFKTKLLVRDKRLKWMQDRGMEVEWRKLSDAEFEKHLRDKLIEEATEVATEFDPKDFIEELGDVLEVIDYLMKLKGISKEEVQNAQDKKRKELGCFDGRVYTKDVQIDSENPAIDYYFKNSHKYPEIEKRRSVRGIILKGDNVLLMKRNRYGDEFYTFPGGGIKKEETKEEALRREILEEVGAEISNIQLFKEIEWKQKETLYTCEIVSLTKPTGNEWQDMQADNTYEIVEVPLTEIASLRLFPEEIKNLILKK